ncbi:hypothetical protein BG003_011029, partial [Podila horticola]
MAKPWTSTYNGKDKHGRKTGTFTVSKVGSNLCFRWPAKNHAVPGENDLSTVNIGISNNYTKGGSTDTWLCSGRFKIPTSVKPGHH